VQTIHLSDLSDRRLDAYCRLKDHQLRSAFELEYALMVVESPFAVQVALESGLEPVSFLIDERHADSMAETLSVVPDDVPVFLAPRELMSEVVGFKVTRGVMGAFRRPQPEDPRSILANAHRVAVLEGLVDASNVGAIFRSAAALGFDAVLLSPTCIDPYSRRAMRVSMGTVLKVPWAAFPSTGDDAWPQGACALLHDLGFHIVAMALDDNAISLDDPTLRDHKKLALFFGTEGWGLTKEALQSCDEAVIIPMSHGVDSLNVATSAAIAFWQLRQK